MEYEKVCFVIKFLPSFVLMFLILPISQLVVSCYGNCLHDVRHHKVYFNWLFVQICENFVGKLKACKCWEMEYAYCEIYQWNYFLNIFKEITALRAKVLVMREHSMTLEQDVREQVKKEFKDVIQNMFNAHFQLRTRFDEFRSVLILIHFMSVLVLMNLG